MTVPRLLLHEGAPVSPPLRVRSIPRGHPYVRSALPTVSDEIELAADPVVDPDDVDRWWPHPALDPRWTDPFDPDLIHVHFGYEHRTADEVRELVALWRSNGRRLVVTVHDLHNPHEADPGEHLARTGVLVQAADAVLTLTHSAAAEIACRWGVRAEVLAHPPIADPESPHRARSSPRGPVQWNAAVFPKIGRANCDPDTPMQALAAVTRRTPHLAAHAFLPVEPAAGTGGREVDIDESCRDEWDRHPRLHLHRVDEPSDDELFAELAHLDLLVLPYRFGTHSGWIELCRDLGVAVVVPDCGHYFDQAQGMLAARYRVGERAGLERALLSLLSSLPAEPQLPQRAYLRRQTSRSWHLMVYKRVIGFTPPHGDANATGQTLAADGSTM